jgi:CheY-like chemotaxis protein
MKTERVVTGRNILIVDDDADARNALKMLLSLDGHKVCEAANGQEACWRFTPGEFDLVITDYAMPGMKGDEFARTIKCIAPAQPIIMITAFVGNLVSQHNPVDAILGKPFTLADLRVVLSSCLSASRSNAALHTAPELEV